MPGIFGFISPNPRPPQEVERDLLAMRRSMAHLPTYKSCTYVGNRVALGRIGPSFLNPEKQPVFNEDGKWMIVFEGELFDPAAARQELEHSGHNFREGCDAEVALHAFEQSGAQGIAKLAGAYVGCIYDSESHACHLFTDRLGLRGCYHSVAVDGTFLFASEMKAIAAIGAFQANVDEEAVATFLNRGCAFFERTFFKEFKFLRQGSVLTFSRGRISENQYWDMPFLRPSAGWKFEDAVDEGVGHLLNSVKRQLRNEGQIGAFLSGGLDSRAIVGSASALGFRLPTFTFGGLRNVEGKLASRVAVRLGLENESFAVAPDHLVRSAERGCWLSDAMLPCSLLSWSIALPHIAARVQSLFSGYLGDVLPGGLSLEPIHLTGLSLETQARLIEERLAGKMLPFVETGLTPAFCHRAQASLREASREVALRLGDRGFYMELARAYIGTRGRRAIGATFSNFVAVFVDVKYPLGDYDLIDYCSRLPIEWRLGSRLYKAIICKALPTLADIPCFSRATQSVPATLDSEPSQWRIAWRDVRRQTRFLIGRLSGGHLSVADPGNYIDYSHFYRTSPSFRQWVESTLLSSRTLDRGYYDRAGITRLLDLTMSRGYVWGILDHMITWEYWNRFFVDRESYQGTGAM
jgi:asparagine synthase (glutamine-hydrolysing)